jgi:hypothetical protein
MARSTTLQSKAGYIDARPLTAIAAKSTCNAREVGARNDEVCFAPVNGHRQPVLLGRKSAMNRHGGRSITSSAGASSRGTMFPSSVCVVLMPCSNLVEWEGPVGMNGCVPSKNDAVVASLGDDLETTTARIEIIDHRKDAQFVSSRLGNQRLYPLAHCLA